MQRDELLKSAKLAAKRFTDRNRADLDARLETLDASQLEIMLKWFEKVEKGEAACDKSPQIPAWN